MDADRYRAIRGIVRHVLIPLRSRPFEVGFRAAIGPTYNWPRQSGTCSWCGLPAPTRRHKWHPYCGLMVNAMKCAITGSSYFYYFPYESDDDRRCLCGEIGTELDHTLALGVAQRISLKAYIAALMPENLRWLCHDCHAAKTRFDRAWMRLLDGPKDTPVVKRQGPFVDPRQQRFVL